MNTIRSLGVCLVIQACLSASSEAKRRPTRDDDTSLAAVVTELGVLSRQVTSLTAQVSALTTQVAAQQAELGKLRQVVAFHVYGEWNNQSLVTVAPHRPITYTNLVLNVGNGFNVQTSFFTAPVTGLYQFHATFMENQDPSNIVHAAIIVEPGIEVALSISDSRHNFFDNTGIQAVVHVRAGQTVHVQNVDDRTASYYGGQYLTFSGFLIRAD